MIERFGAYGLLYDLFRRDGPYSRDRVLDLFGRLGVRPHGGASLGYDWLCCEGMEVPDLIAADEWLADVRLAERQAIENGGPSGG